MATTTGPDLTPAVRAVERLMDDTCVIVRNPGGVQDAVLNQVTGALVDPDSRDPVYRGKCKIGGTGLVLGSRTEGGVSFEGETLALSLPLDSPQLLEGDVVTMTSSRRDPQLKGQTFTVIRIIYSSMAVSRKVLVEARR